MRSAAHMAAALLLAAAAACEPTRPAPAAGSPQEQRAAAHEAAARGAPADGELRLVVFLVIDQLPSWSFSDDLEVLDGGLARLVRGGAYFPYVELPYASTFTAPGHAALATGAPPAVSGILANDWYDRRQSQVRDATEDPAYPVLRAGGGTTGEGAAPTALRVEGIADVLRRERPGARAVSIGMKARAAILALGRRPQLAVWYDADQAAMTTSRYYADALPPWLAALGREAPIERYRDFRWRPTDPALLERAVGADDAAGEGSFYGLDSTFPHDLGQLERPMHALQATPASSAITIETALAAIEGEALGDDEVPDLLGVSFSSHDYAGHVWGQTSWERLDLLLRLDHQIGDLLDELDARVGAGRYAVVLASDHGATPVVEKSLARGQTAHRCDINALLAAAQRAATQVLGEGRWVVGTWANTLYLSDAFRRIPEPLQSAAVDAILAELEGVAGTGFIARTDAISGDCDRLSDPLARLACRSIRPGDSGEIFCAMDELSVPKEEYETGTAHGSPNPEDRIVPVAVYGPGIEPRVDPRAVSLLQVAPTLAELLGVSAPEAADEPPLVERKPANVAAQR